MSLIYYNSVYEVPAFGLCNSGVICYFNSMLQCLLSCTSFTELFTVSERVKTRNALSREVAELVARAARSDTAVSEMSCRVWQALIAQLRGKKQHEFGRGQEDANEGFVLFVDALESPEVEQLFEHRYRIVTHCGHCDHRHESQDENLLMMFSRQEFETDDFAGLITKPRTEIDQAFRCSKCGKAGAKTQVRCLRMTPEIITVVLKKYDSKWNVKCPGMLRVSDSFQYRLVATCEHTGTRDSGHYYANVTRSTGAYVANDMSCHKTGSISSTANTYMAWYHVYKPVDIDELSNMFENL